MAVTPPHSVLKKVTIHHCSGTSHRIFFLLLDVTDFFLSPVGGIIMFGGLLLFDQDFIHVVSITFTALILTELLMVALTIRTWHWLMLLAEVISLALYIGTLIVLRGYFGKLRIRPFKTHQVVPYLLSIAMFKSRVGWGGTP